MADVNATRPAAPSSPGWLIRTILIAAIVALQFMASPAGAQGPADEAVAERRVKAAYLHRFASYVEWPDGVFARPDSPLVIAVWGNDDLADDLARLVATRVIDGRRFEVRRIREVDSAAAPHMLFVGRERIGRLPEAMAGLRPRAILVVTESAGALKQGSVINFLMNEGQVRFELSLDAAEQYSLKLSSRLVAVAAATSGRTR